MKCRFSGKDIPVVHSFGMQPLANGFLQEPTIKDEYFFEMSVAVNLENGLFQLVNQPNPSQMFHENYAFYSRTSNFMKKHFAGLGIEPQTSKMNSLESWCLNPLGYKISINLRLILLYIK